MDELEDRVNCGLWRMAAIGKWKWTSYDASEDRSNVWVGRMIKVRFWEQDAPDRPFKYRMESLSWALFGKPSTDPLLVIVKSTLTP